MTPSSVTTQSGWRPTAALVARFVFATMFLMACVFKFMGIGMTAQYIAAAGFPMALPLAWIAALFEAAFVIALLTGGFYAEACLLAAIYIIFLAFAFHGSSHWGQDQLGQLEFGAFVSHFPFAAGLLAAAAYGPGRWAARFGWLDRR